jgi:hypothetical protein
MHSCLNTRIHDKIKNIIAIKSFENVAKFKQLEMKVTNSTYMMLQGIQATIQFRILYSSINSPKA